MLFLFDTTGWGPYAYFDALLEESNARDEAVAAAQTTNALAVQTMEVQVVNRTLRSFGDNFSSPTLDSDQRSRLDDIEFGRK